MSYYEAKEHWIAYQKEKKEKKRIKIQFEHNELFASVSALSLIIAIGILAFYIV